RNESQYGGLHTASSEEDSDTIERERERPVEIAASTAPRFANTTRFAHRSPLTMKPKPRGARTKNMDKLIEAVQARECLWDKSYRGHRNRFKLERYWNEVASEVGTSSVNCRKKWKNLKDQCRKEMKKHPSDSDWPHFNKLKFIHNQFLADDDDGDQDTADEVLNSLDETLKTPKLGYTMRKKLLMNKRRTIDVDMSKLIDLVRTRELIWNRGLKGHHNWYKLDECWKEIAQELDCTRNLSQDYEPEASSSYYAIEEPPPPSCPIPEVAASKDEEYDEFDSKPVIMETDFYDDDDAPKSVNDTGEPKDEDVGFFDSLLPHVKKLGPAKKLMLRMKIQELVYNTVYNET
ncbi:Transcription factor Adf-1, partial [Operophtera brumata]